MSKSELTADVEVKRNVSSPVLTTLTMPMRMKNTEGEEGRGWKYLI